MQKDAFKPQGREISVMGMGSPLAVQGNAPRRQMPPAPTMGRSQPSAQPPAPTAPVGRGAPISDRAASFKPMGTQVRMAGSSMPLLDGAPVDRGTSFQPSEPTQIIPATQPELAAAPAQLLAQAPRPFLQRQQPNETVFRVTMRGRTADGSEYASVYDAVMPPGTQPIALDFAPLT
jgi:hypothetical protein